jgi:hypothetical protein
MISIWKSPRIEVRDASRAWVRKGGVRIKLGDRYLSLDTGSVYEVVLIDGHQVVLKGVVLRLHSLYELRMRFSPYQEAIAA